MLLLLGAFLRSKDIATLPSGLSDNEIDNIRIIETAREGDIEVFYDLGNEGREGVYHVTVAFLTSLTGSGMLGYRMLSVWAGMLALATIYAVGRRLFGYLVGLCALALMTVGFWPILLSRQVIPETLLPLLVAATLLSLMIAFPVYNRRTKDNENINAATALGVLLGLGLYIHPVGILTVLFSLAFILFITRSQHQPISRRRINTYISFTLLLMLIIGMPYLISSIRHLDLSGTNRLVGDEPHYSAQTVVQALGGIFIVGDENPLNNLPERPMFDAITGLLIIVGVVTAIIDWQKPRSTLLLTATAVLSPVFLLAAQAPAFINYAASLPLLALFFGLGVQTTANALPRLRHSRKLIGTGLVILLIFNINWTADTLFNEWPNTPQVEAKVHARLGRLAHYADQTVNDTPTVICGWEVDQSPGSPTLSDAQLIELMMTRKDAPVRYVDCEKSMIFIAGGEGQQIILPDPDIFSNTSTQILFWLGQGVFLENKNIPNDGVLWLAVRQPLADALGQIQTQSSVYYAPEVGGNPDERLNPPINFGNNVTLLGYIPPESNIYGTNDVLNIITYWRIDGDIPTDLRLFTHILADPGASPPANTDIINVNPRYLKNLDVFVQVTCIPSDCNPPMSPLPVGEYQISIGAYQVTQLPDNQRLKVHDSNGDEHGDRLFLYPIIIEEAE
jgi:hypothetical protein